MKKWKMTHQIKGTKPITQAKAQAKKATNNIIIIVQAIFIYGTNKRFFKQKQQFK